MRFPITVAHRTDTGLEKAENQDSVGYICDERHDLHLLIVADGVGSAPCGREASDLAVQTIRQSFFAGDQGSVTAQSIRERLVRAIAEANRVIIQRGRRDRHCRGMGSTCAVLVLNDGLSYIAHAGDSRVYLVRDSRIIRLTRDHSLVGRMLDDGLITEEEAANHPERNALERALGMREEIRVDLRAEPLLMDWQDIIVICTDGLSSLVADEEIYRIVRSSPVAAGCEELIGLANKRGGHDNISVAILRVGADITARM